MKLHNKSDKRPATKGNTKINKLSTIRIGNQIRQIEKRFIMETKRQKFLMIVEIMMM